MLYKIKSAISGKKVEEEPAPVTTVASVSTGEIPSVDSPEFEKYLENLLESEEQLKALIEKAG